MLPAVKKEIFEGIRTYKFIVVLAVFMFFSLMNPILNKMVLPEVLKSQLIGMDEAALSQMVISSQKDCVISYLGDVFEIATLVLVLLLAPIVAGEIHNKTFTFAKCSNKNFSKLVLAKLTVYGLVVMMVSEVGVLVDYAYSGALFGNDMYSAVPVIRSGFLQGLYFMYVIALVMFLGTLIKKPISAGLLALIPAYGTVILSQLLDLDSFTPAGLLTEANLLADGVTTAIFLPMMITVLLIGILTFGTVLILDRMELA